MTLIRSNDSRKGEESFYMLRRVGIFGEGRLIFVGARENCQQVGKPRKVSILDRFVERLLYAMIARDESWIDVSHRLGACVGFPPVNGQTRSPLGGPTVVGARVREQAARLGVCRLIRGGGAEPTKGQCEVRGVLMHRLEQVADEVEIAAFIAGDSELVPHSGKPMLLIARHKRGDRLVRQL